MPTDLPEERRVRAPGSMELDPSSGETVAIDETTRLIASSKVEGRPVFDGAGEQLGTVHTIMIDKVSGQVAYAVMSSGGFLGIDEHYHPLPWSAMRYSEALGGYVVEHDPRAPEGAQSRNPGDDPGPTLETA